MSNIFLPRRDDVIVKHTMGTNNNVSNVSNITYSWTAPNAKNNGDNYNIEVFIWGGGGEGALGYYPHRGGGGGGGGAFWHGYMEVSPGTVYTFVAAGSTATSSRNSASAGGAEAGENGKSSLIKIGLTTVLTAAGGSGASLATSSLAGKSFGGAGGTTTLNASGLTTFTNYIAIDGAEGGDGGDNEGTSSPSLGVNESAVPQYYPLYLSGGKAGDYLLLPIDIGNVTAPVGDDDEGRRRGGAPGGASASGNGGRAGIGWDGSYNFNSSTYTQESIGSGGGGAGYFDGDDAGWPPLVTNTSGVTGFGSAGRITISFAATGGINQGSAPSVVV